MLETFLNILGIICTILGALVIFIGFITFLAFIIYTKCLEDDDEIPPPSYGTN
jgi:hypothetical protein